MDVRGLRGEDAIAPVVGVVLMIGITALLISSIAIFVFDSTDTVESSPDADFAFSYEGDVNRITIEQIGGNRIDGDNIVIRGENLGAGNDGKTWSQIEPSHSRVVTGSTITISAPPDYELRVVYEDGESSKTLATSSGPAA